MGTLLQILASLQASVRVGVVHAQMPEQGHQFPRHIPNYDYQIETSLYICLFYLSLLDLMTTHKWLFSDSHLVVAQRH